MNKCKLIKYYLNTNLNKRSKHASSAAIYNAFKISSYVCLLGIEPKTLASLVKFSTSWAKQKVVNHPGFVIKNLLWFFATKTETIGEISESISIVYEMLVNWLSFPNKAASSKLKAWKLRGERRCNLPAPPINFSLCLAGSLLSGELLKTDFNGMLEQIPPLPLRLLQLLKPRV